MNVMKLVHNYFGLKNGDKKMPQQVISAEMEIKNRTFEVLTKPQDSPWWKVRIDYGEAGNTESTEIEMFSHSDAKRIFTDRLRKMNIEKALNK